MGRYCFCNCGTVTLTCGLFSIPTIVCYKTSLLNEFIFNSFVKYDGLVSLTNLILEKEVFPELIQEYLSTFNLVSEFKKLVDNQDTYKETVCELDKLRLKLDTSNFDVADYLSSRFKEIHYQKSF